MTILSGDIKLIKSQVMLDTDDGGGGTTDQEIIDGQSNNMFPDISELDRVYGRISLRKTFAWIDTNNTDSYFGSHVIIDKRPLDPQVNVTLFSTRDWFDRRTSASDRVESYLAKGGRWAGHVYETQLEGQRVIQIVTRVEDAEPTTGQALCIVQNETTGAQFEQFVRVTAVSSVVQRFSLSVDKDVTRKVVTIEISDPLRQTFAGLSVRQFEQGGGAAGAAILRETRVADAANYYSIQPLAVSASIGQAQIQVEDIFTNIVPSSQQEVPLIGLDAAGQSLVFVNSGDVIENRISIVVNGTNAVYFGSPILPQSLSFTLFGQSVVDDAGELRRGSEIIGSISYAEGLIRWNSSAGTGSESVLFRYKPAATKVRPSRSGSITVTEGNRGFNWIRSLLPLPSPATLQVSYNSQGKVYVLRDNGNGQLKGSDAAFGTGTVSYETGTVVLTTGALPDVGTVIMYNWGTVGGLFERSSTVGGKAHFVADLNNGNPAGQDLTVSWQLDGVSKSASVDSSGAITGDATGRVNFVTGAVEIAPNVLPEKGTLFSLSYTARPAGSTNVRQSYTVNVTATALSTSVHEGRFSVAGTGRVEPNTIQLSVGVRSTVKHTVGALKSYIYRSVDLTDRPISGSPDLGVLVSSGGGIMGNIDYATREVILFPSYSAAVDETVFFSQSSNVSSYAIAAYGGESSNTANFKLATDEPNPVTVFYDGAAAAASESATKQVAVNQLRYGIALEEQQQVSPTSVGFTFGDLHYTDRENGDLLHSINTGSGAGTVAGKAIYDQGVLNIDLWSAGEPNLLEFTALSTRKPEPPITAVSFRTPIVPIRSQSVTVTCKTIDNVDLVLTADADGNIENDNATGRVDYENGIVSIDFFRVVLITLTNRPAIEAEPWYDAALEYIDGANTYIRAPVWILPDTLHYNAVGFSYLPLSADILGLDPVRLPSDGRVPIYRVGDVIVLHDTQSEEFVGAADGQTLDVGRVRLASLRIVDSEGLPLPVSMYSVDLDAGTVTLNNTFDIESLTAPLYAEHRIEDMAVVTDLQINGLLNLNRPITHNYSTASSVSSALILGDLQGRVFGRFSQAAWTNEWSDQRIGDPTTANYNDAIYPLVTTNKGAIQERWAIIFISASAFRVVGENVGQIATGSTSELCAPINPASGAPYFSVPAEGWGGGWAAGNVMRFNTQAANYPLWVARTIKAGEAVEDDDRFSIQIRGDIDRV